MEVIIPIPICSVVTGTSQLKIMRKLDHSLCPVHSKWLHNSTHVPCSLQSPHYKGIGMITSIWKMPLNRLIRATCIVSPLVVFFVFVLLFFVVLCTINGFIILFESGFIDLLSILFNIYNVFISICFWDTNPQIQNYTNAGFHLLKCEFIPEVHVTFSYQTLRKLLFRSDLSLSSTAVLVNQQYEEFSLRELAN